MDLYKHTTKEIMNAAVWLATEDFTDGQLMDASCAAQCGGDSRDLDNDIKTQRLVTLRGNNGRPIISSALSHALHDLAVERLLAEIPKLTEGFTQ